MLKVIAACGSGMGSSQIIKMKITKVFKKLGIDVTIQHSVLEKQRAKHPVLMLYSVQRF